MRTGRAAWRRSTFGQFSTYDEGEIRTLAGYDGPTRPRTIEEFWAEHARHGVTYKRDDIDGTVAMIECEKCYGAALYLNEWAALIGEGLFFEVAEE